MLIPMTTVSMCAGAEHRLSMFGKSKKISPIRKSEHVLYAQGFPYDKDRKEIQQFWESRALVMTGPGGLEADPLPG